MATRKASNNMSTRNQPARNEPTLTANRNCPPQHEINILLLGQTGVGKSTFINAFANYIVYDTLKEAVNSKIQTVIPSSFAFTDPNTFKEMQITLDEENEYEQFKKVGESNTQQCRSFVFPIGDRNLRFIDTPGIADTRGLEHDTKNFQDILTYVSQYEHLNGVFILLKPDEQRLNILFRFSVNELLRRLQIGAKENLTFIFTNSRSTFYMPGASSRMLRELIDQHKREHNIDIPFSRDNSFLFDNEGFRYLAIRQHSIELNDDLTQSYTKSWDHSLTEYTRLMKYVKARPLHPVSNFISLNGAEQLIRKLPRPLAETTKMIEQNIQLAKDHKKKVLENPKIASEKMPQINAAVKPLRHPRTVCTNTKCCQVIGEGPERKIKFLFICHDECYLKSVVQETLDNEEISDCEAMNPHTGVCKKCNCEWKHHKHITYECDTHCTYAEPYVADRAGPKKELTLADIDKHISALREEERQIQEVYRRLAQFLHANAILPINDGYIDYLKYFIREEEMKQNAGAHNRDAIVALEKEMAAYNNDIELFKKTLQAQRDAGQEVETLKPEDVFTLVGTLYHLPINGKSIREQVKGIKISQERLAAHRENFVELPGKAASSRVMQELKVIVCEKTKR